MKKKEKQKIKEKKEKKRRVDAWDWELSHLGPTVQNGFQPGPDSKGMESNPVWSRGFWRPQRFRIFLVPPPPIWSPTAVFRTRAGNPPFLRCTQPVIFGPILCSVVAKKRNGDVARSWTGSFIKSPMNNCWTFFWTLTCQRRCYKNLRIKNELDWNKFIK